MKARPTRAVSVGVLTCAFVLAGCSTDASTDAAAPGPSASRGPAHPTSASITHPAGSSSSGSGDEVTIRSRGFTVVPREGWVGAADRVHLPTLTSSRPDATSAVTELDTLLSTWART
ncbi:hypothetical protein GCM10009868_24260 [Terrabacter aerolatus]|uniref:Uncharacterized protein n=1 Tax=Terrabacter aerolatus TaxID=422442 RepID=A0A512D1G6_9MICO|nr:hypothetical protein [Terrabacter aerolatus]GEO30309.1 hypothetical protein TAE01_21190 [Terrabacter aerolatus]